MKTSPTCSGSAVSPVAPVRVRSACKRITRRTGRRRQCSRRAASLSCPWTDQEAKGNERTTTGASLSASSATPTFMGSMACSLRLAGSSEGSGRTNGSVTSAIGFWTWRYSEWLPEHVFQRHRWLTRLLCSDCSSEPELDGFSVALWRLRHLCPGRFGRFWLGVSLDQGMPAGGTDWDFFAASELLHPEHYGRLADASLFGEKPATHFVTVTESIGTTMTQLCDRTPNYTGGES